MPKENDDIEPGLQQDLQPAAPTGPNGCPNGPEPGPPGRPEVPHVGPTASPAAPEAAAALQARGEPGTLPLTWCKRCEAMVLPEGKGRCPRCQTFLRLNFARRKHPVNVLRRQQLLDKLIDEYHPSTQRLRSMCEQYAAILEQLETMKPGSPDHQRLVQLSQLLGADLEASRASREAKEQHNFPGVEQMPMSACELAQDLLARLAAGETLNDYERGQLDVLDRAMRGELLLRGELVDDPSALAIDPAGPACAEPPGRG